MVGCLDDQTHPECVLVRHGETAWSLDGRHTGRTDLPLTPVGEAQAAALAPRPGRLRFTAVLASPLVRARATAALAGLDDAEIDPDLAEWDYGDYEGLTTARHPRRTGPGGTSSPTGCPAASRSTRWRPGSTG